MNEHQLLGLRAELTIYEAARWITQGKGGHAAEGLIIEGINAGEIAASIIRWENGYINQMETTIKRSDLDEWLKARGRFPLDEQQQDTGALQSNERNSLLTIIAALCDHSNIRHGERGVAGKIANMTEKIGAPVSQDTVLRALSKIPDALESRSK